MIDVAVSRPLHTTKKEISKSKYAKLENLQKHKKNNECLMVAIEKHCKTQHFQYFWLPDPYPEPQKPKKTTEFLMVAIKNHCKTQVF